jgi:PleD family two-component response regulator
MTAEPAAARERQGAMADRREGAMADRGARLDTPNALNVTGQVKTRDHGILIVDDDVDIRQELSAFLSGEGFLCATAASGNEGLRYPPQRGADYHFSYRYKYAGNEWP